MGILSQVSAPTTTLPTGFGSYKTVGVQREKNGRLSFNRDAFLASYDKNPTDTQTAVSTGVGKQILDRVTKDNTDLTATVTSHDNYIGSLNKQIAAWDPRLATRKQALQRQFTNLEVALGKLHNQSSWLSGQIASLPTGR
jgi:flagellar hook-associated protein 2